MSNILQTLQALGGQPPAPMAAPAAPVPQPQMAKGSPFANAMQLLHQKHVQGAQQAHSHAQAKAQTARAKAIAADQAAGRAAWAQGWENPDADHSQPPPAPAAPAAAPAPQPNPIAQATGRALAGGVADNAMRIALGPAKARR